MSRKKIVFVIVEGLSDEEALGVILTRIYDRDSVYVHVMHSDITTALDVNSQNVVSKIGNIVKGYAGKHSSRTTLHGLSISQTWMEQSWRKNCCGNMESLRRTVKLLKTQRF